jgi:hypothetical protein
MSSLLRRVIACCAAILALTVLPSQPAPTQGSDATDRPTPRVVFQVPGSRAIVLVSGDTVHDPMSPSGPWTVRRSRGNPSPELRVDLTEQGSTRSEVWAEGLVTIRLSTGESLWFDNLMDRVRVTFEKQGFAWRIVVEALPASLQIP